MNNITAEHPESLVVSTKNSEILTKEHHDYLVNERKLLPEWVELNFRSISKETARAEHYKYVLSGGILLRGLNVSESQLRPDTMRQAKDKDKKPKFDKDGKPKLIKYESASLGDYKYDVMLPASPGGKFWGNLEEVEINICEGFIKAVTLCQNNIHAIAIKGVDMGLRKNEKGEDELVPTLKTFAASGAKFNIIFDCDDNPETIKKVEKSKIKLAYHLYKAGASCVRTAPKWGNENGTCKGIDDLLNNKGIDAVREVLSNSTVIDFDAETDSKSKDKTKGSVELARTLEDEYRGKYLYDLCQSSWREFDDGVWLKILPKKMQAKVLEDLLANGENVKTYNQYVDAAKTLSDRLHEEKMNVLDSERYIAFSNGIYDLEEDKLLEHSPVYRLTAKLPYPYESIVHDVDVLDDLQAHCPHIYSFFNRAMSGNKVAMESLVAIVAAVLKRLFSKLHMFIYLQGKPRTGKGTFERLLTKIVGEHNSYGTGLNKLGNDYEVANYIDKWLVTIGDVRDKVGVDFLLKITGGDKISYRQIYQAAASDTFNGSLMIAANNFVFSGDTTGIDSRIKLIEFDNPISVKDRNSNVENYYESEIPKLVSIALNMNTEEVISLIKGTGENSVAKFKLLAWRNLLRDDELKSIASFVDERIVEIRGCDIGEKIGNGRKDVSGNFDTATLYGSYRDYCINALQWQEKDVKTLDSFTHAFTEIMTDKRHVPAKRDPQRKKNGYFIRGEFKLRTGEDDEPTYSELLEYACMAEKNEEVGLLPVLVHPGSPGLPGKDLSVHQGVHQVFTGVNETFTDAPQGSDVQIQGDEPDVHPDEHLMNQDETLELMPSKPGEPDEPKQRVNTSLEKNGDADILQTKSPQPTNQARVDEILNSLHPVPEVEPPFKKGDWVKLTNQPKASTLIVTCVVGNKVWATTLDKRTGQPMKGMPSNELDASELELVSRHQLY